MLGKFLIIVISLIFAVNSFSEECRSSVKKSASDRAADDWLGLKCDPLDKGTWQENWTSPCDCLSKGDKFSRIKDALFKKNRKNREDMIVDLLEKKVGDVLNSQIDSGFEQALRLDALLKQGVFLENSPVVMENFPESCRINKVKDVVLKQKNESSCDQKTYDRRLKALLGNHKDIDEFIENKMTTLKKATMNQLGPQDKAQGMCIPYKSFQSMNNSNPLRKTYLKIAALKYDFAQFQEWALDRQDPKDTFFLIGVSEVNKSLKKNSAPIKFGKTPLDFGKIGSINSKFDMGASLTAAGARGLDFDKDLESGIEAIDADQIQHLIKTDPIFERMVKDPAFYKKIQSGELGNLDNFNENDKKVVGALMASQNNQCKSLYGEIESKPTGKLVSGGGKRGSQVSQTTTEEKNILTQYLCDENFPKRFLNKDNIQNVLAPEFKKKADINGLKHTEAIIAKWGYCKGDDYKVSEENGFEIHFELKTATDLSIETQPLARLLNLSLNPSSDLMSNRNNLYTRFNKEICPHMEKECIDPDPSSINFNCTISQIATDVSEKIIKSKLPEEVAKTLISDFSEAQVSDKYFRDSLVKIGNFSEDQINAIISLRNQTPHAKYARAKKDLRHALSIPNDQSLEDYYAKNGGIEAVLNNPNLSSDIKERLNGIKTGYRSDNIHGETTSAQNSSYFANYFALGVSTDEGKIATYKKESKLDTSSGSNSQGSSRIGSTPGQQPNTPVGQTGGVDSPSTNTGSFYQRREFDSPAPVNQPIQAKKIDPPPQEGSKELASSPKEEAPSAVKTIKEEVVTREIPSGGSSNKATGNLGSGIVLTNNGNGRSLGGTADNSSALEKQKKDLEDRINRLNDEINNFDNGRSDSGDSGNPELDDLKKRLKDLIEDEKMKRNGGNTGGKKYSNNDNNSGKNWNGGFGNDFNSNWSNNVNNNYNTPPFNNGYGRGEEFMNEQAKNKLDDGGEEFDPENSKKGAVASGSSNGASGGKAKGAGGANGGGVSLSSNDGDDESGSGGGRTKGRRKKGQGGSGTDDQELIAKCGTGPILKCIFPNSYFTDDEVKGRLYVTIANLKLEGRKFQTLEKVRKSKKEMRMGESNKAKYFLYTYDVVLDSEKRQVTNDEREELYKDIKENRKNPTFKKKLIKIRYMTKVVPPKVLLNDKEALEIINRTITPEEYEELELLND